MEGEMRIDTKKAYISDIRFKMMRPYRGEWIIKKGPNSKTQWKPSPGTDAFYIGLETNNGLRIVFIAEDGYHEASSFWGKD